MSPQHECSSKDMRYMSSAEDDKVSVGKIFTVKNYIETIPLLEM